MSRVLKLHNTFTKVVDEVRLGGKLVSTNHDSLDTITGSLYICGPTVYSDSHLGHALTYVRSDLFRRFMKSIFNVRLMTVMNITDVDDKILTKVEQEFPETLAGRSENPTEHPFNKVSDKYYRSFSNDMKLIRVEPPDLILKVSKHVPLIVKYIQILENMGYAYVTPKNDIYFHTVAVKNYVGRIMKDTNFRTNPDEDKKDPRDFALWKAAKPGEPTWSYYSNVARRNIPGRPGWHVQCSALSNAIFGDKLDFHFGGRDLVFPHHYNEEACCCAYHKLDTSKSLHVWSKHWMHSGHLVSKDHKMSKSIGNVIPIRRFIDDSSINALRLLCIVTHYESNVDITSTLMDGLKSIDHKLSAFINHLSEGLRKIRDVGLTETGSPATCTDLQNIVEQVHTDILDGVCDRFDLNKGLDSILDLIKMVYNRGLDNLGPQDRISIWHLLENWLRICGLEYGPLQTSHDDPLLSLVREFRQKVRLSSVLGLKQLKYQGTRQESEENYSKVLIELLKECDNTRSRLDELGYVERDNLTKDLRFTKTR